MDRQSKEMPAGGGAGGQKMDDAGAYIHAPIVVDNRSVVKAFDELKRIDYNAWWTARRRYLLWQAAGYRTREVGDEGN